jgi:hypothetical protein
MNAVANSIVISGRISPQESVMRMALGLGAIVGVLTGGITGEHHMFAAAVLCIYLGITAIIGQDPFYYFAEKWISGHSKSAHATSAAISQTQPLRVVSPRSRSAA